MDLLLELADEFVLDSQYAAVANATSASYPWLGEHLVRHALLRQSLSLYFITAIGGLITYLAVASFSYVVSSMDDLSEHDPTGVGRGGRGGGGLHPHHTHGCVERVL